MLYMMALAYDSCIIIHTEYYQKPLYYHTNVEQAITTKKITRSSGNNLRSNIKETRSPQTIRQDPTKCSRGREQAAFRSERTQIMRGIEQQRQRSIAALKRRAAALGFQINPLMAAAA